MTEQPPSPDVRVVSALRGELARIAREDAAGRPSRSRPLLQHRKRALAFGVALAACAAVVAVLPGGDESHVARAAVERLAPTLIPGVAASGATCESEAESGIGIWHCLVPVRGENEPAELEITIHADGSYESQAVGTPAFGGCCLPVED